MVKIVESRIPDIYLPIFYDDAVNNILLWGGRAAGRSVQGSEKFVLECSKLPEGCVGMALRWRFNSLEESSKAEIESIIKQLEIPCEILNTEVRFKNGGRIIYGQLHDISSVKSTKNLCKVWIEEAQFVENKKNIHTLMNTMRVPEYAREKGIKPLLIATMNRITPNDATWDYFCALPIDQRLLVYATIDDNPFAPPELLQKRDDDRAAMERGDIGAMTWEEFRLEWDGIPSNVVIDGVYDYDKLIDCMDSYDEDIERYVAGIDLAYGGTDKCVYTLLGVHSGGHKSIVKSSQWRSKGQADTINRIKSLIAQDLPEKIGLDAGDGGGMGIYSQLKTDGIKKLERFIPGASFKAISGQPANTRAAATLRLGVDVENKKIHSLSMAYIEDMKNIKKIRIAENAIRIERKEDMRKRSGKSPDLHDSLVIANYMADKTSGFMSLQSKKQDFKQNSWRDRNMLPDGVKSCNGILIKQGGRFSRK